VGRSARRHPPGDLTWVICIPGRNLPRPRSSGEQSFGNLIAWNEVDKSAHFAAREQPRLFSEEVRAAFRSLR
jgi:hypothetical protein